MASMRPASLRATSSSSRRFLARPRPAAPSRASVQAEFTVVGDTVNVASRIEAMSRTLKVAILASDAVVAAVQRENGDEFLDGFQDLGTHTIRGHKSAFRLWG